MKKGIFLILITAMLVLPSCRGNVQKGGPQAPATHAFPRADVPTMMTDESQRVDYITGHYWDKFLAGGGVTDTSAILGVRKADIEYNVSSFLMLLDYLPMDKAQQQVEKFFRDIEQRQEKEPQSNFYLLMTEIVARYMYDPNSPLRSEDYFLPFVTGLAQSRFTRDDVRQGYEFQRSMCSMNRYGTQVPDFRFVDAKGRMNTLFGVKGRYTILFFSNPGCHSCREIIDQLNADRQLTARIMAGDVAVVNVYIDEDVDKWREYVPEYPESWHSGYDPDLVIRDNSLYYVRAIPSLYLLDSEKRVIFKDAPTEKVLGYLSNNR